MRDEGLLTFYKLTNTAQAGDMPVEQLVDCDCTAYYENRTIGMQRRYLAKSADFQLDRLVRCYNTIIPEDAKYVILEDGMQYRIGDASAIVDEDAYDLSLERLNDYYEVADAANSNTQK